MPCGLGPQFWAGKWASKRLERPENTLLPQTINGLAWSDPGWVGFSCPAFVLRVPCSRDQSIEASACFSVVSGKNSFNGLSGSGMNPYSS